MKNVYLKAFVFILLLCAQVFAQRFTIIEPDIFDIGGQSANGSSTGYFPSLKQIAALGEKNSIYANLMLLGGRDTSFKEGQESVGTYNVVDSHGNVLGIVHPLSEPNVFSMPNGDEIHDNSATAVVVLDSLNGSKNTATVLFASLRRLIVMRITISSTNSVSFSILSNMDMPKLMWEVDGNYKVSQVGGTTYTRRLALLGISQSGTGKTYYLATGNSYSKNGTDEKSGRVDFFNIMENSWAFFQPNTKGLVSGENGLFFNENTYFGKDLAVIDNFDKKGGKALAVLLPISTDFPNSALYIFKMDNDWTPSTELPIVISRDSKHWPEKPGQTQECGGLTVANWEDETTHLLVSCGIFVSGGNDGDIHSIIIVKDIVLDSTGNILSSSILSSEKISVKNPVPRSYYVNSNPVAIKNHKNDLHSIALAIRSSMSGGFQSNSMAIFTVMDSSKVSYNEIPANPGNDTIWNVSEKRYIALPLSNSSGNIYTYDIVQDSLNCCAEIIGNYLHILLPLPEFVGISIAYTENGKIMHRKIYITPEPKPTPIVASAFTQNLNAVSINGGLQINGLNGKFELRAYNFKGVEIQREKANAQGSVFVKLKQNCPQIVQIKSANEKFYLKVTYGK